MMHLIECNALGYILIRQFYPTCSSMYYQDYYIIFVFFRLLILIKNLTLMVSDIKHSVSDKSESSHLSYMYSVQGCNVQLSDSTG